MKQVTRSTLQSETYALQKGKFFNADGIRGVIAELKGKLVERKNWDEAE